MELGARKVIEFWAVLWEFVRSDEGNADDGDQTHEHLEGNLSLYPGGICYFKLRSHGARSAAAEESAVINKRPESRSETFALLG